MKNNRRNREIYPGVDNRFVICDVCGKKFRVKDTVRIVDRYNLLNNMIVCFADADQTNPQIKPIHIYEDLLLRKDYVRPEATYMTYTNTENEDRIGSAPRNLVASLDPLSNKVQLTWDGPLDYGNARVLGYRIYRREGFVDPIFYVINPNTYSLATYYLDLTADVSLYYEYVVSMVTDLGESPVSNSAYFPKLLELDYLSLSQDADLWIALSQDESSNLILVFISKKPTYIVLSQDLQLLIALSQDESSNLILEE